MMVESLVLAAGGALLGIGMAYAGVRVLAVMGPASLPRIQTISIDPMVLGFTALAALFAAAIFGVVPALRASQPRVGDVLRTGGRSAGQRAGRWLRSSVVMTEVALSLVLLIGSGLMLRSFIELQRVDPGFNPDGVLTFLVTNVRAPGVQGRAAFMRQMEDRLKAIPGVQSVTAANPMPLDGGPGLARWGTEAAIADPNLFQQGAIHFVRPGYFEALGTRLIQGRTFTDEDNVPGLRRIVIDDMLAAMAFPNESAVGKQLLTRIITEQAEPHEVIGVVQHQHHTSLAQPGEEGMFVTDGYGGFGRTNRWALRTSGDPEQIGALVREAVKELDPRLVVAQMLPMQEYVDRAGASTRFALLLVVVFGVIAAVLAIVGLYGVLSTGVAHRQAEIGVRMTFGATKANIVKLVVGDGLWLSAIGVLLGLGAAFALTRAMSSMLVGISPTDPVTFLGIAVLFLIIAAIASWLPARRAAGFDPSIALREE
jgi:putative ABC transport system permease protein